jgi:hypothetical protein
VSKDSGKKKLKKGKDEYVKSEYTREVAEGQLCKIHSTTTKQANHLLRDCNIWNDRPAAKGGKGKSKAKPAEQKPKKDDSEEEDDDSMSDGNAVLHVFATTEEEASHTDISSTEAVNTESETLHVFTTIEKSEERSILRAVNATVPLVPQWLPWSEVDVSWMREDHPALIK